MVDSPRVLWNPREKGFCMRVVFLGSPEVVVGVLEELVHKGKNYGVEVVGVVSQPPRPVGRGRELLDPPVAKAAKELGIPVLQPERSSDETFLSQFSQLKPDVAITAAFGQILPAKFLEIPRRGTINIHPSLLPKYRGATPVPSAIAAGETHSGVTILFTVQKLDAGAIILQAGSSIGPSETSGQMTKRLFDEGGHLLFEALHLLKDPSFQGKPQDEAQVTHCKKFSKEDGLVAWEGSCEDIYNRYRAFEPWPGSYSFLQGRRVSLVGVKLGNESVSHLMPGEVIFDKREKALRVGTGEGTILITKLKPAGGKEVQAEAFWNGMKDRSLVRFANGESL